MGYIAIAILFLAIGAMSDSMREAQGYLMPVLLAIILPISLLIQAVASGIGERGTGQRGDKTMLDVWLPAADAAAQAHHRRR